MLISDVYAKLCAPFPIDLVEVRPGATNRDRTRALAMPYADIRVYQQALDEIVGAEGWQVSYRPWGEGAVFCQLTLLGMTREDAGELSDEGDNKHTSAIARAFKRACSSFGLGRYLYGLPQVWGDYDAEKRSFTDARGLVEQIYRQAGIRSPGAKAATDKARWAQAQPINRPPGNPG